MNVAVLQSISERVIQLYLYSSLHTVDPKCFILSVISPEEILKCFSLIPLLTSVWLHFICQGGMSSWLPRSPIALLLWKMEFYWPLSSNATVHTAQELEPFSTGIFDLWIQINILKYELELLVIYLCLNNKWLYLKQGECAECRGWCHIWQVILHFCNRNYCISGNNYLMLFVFYSVKSF